MASQRGTLKDAVKAPGYSDLSRYRDYEAADARTALDEGRMTNKAACRP